MSRRWLAATPTFVAGRSYAERKPWGTVHAREIGGLTTACGMPAIRWHLFYGTPFGPNVESACERCLSELTGRIAT